MLHARIVKVKAARCGLRNHSKKTSGCDPTEIASRGAEEDFFRSLEIPYRIVDTCTGDLGSSAARKFDVEAWSPSQGKYREITSTSNTTDFQARRLECRVRLPDGNRTLHTVNGTLCAIGRTLIALHENHQRADGSVALPRALHRYLREGDQVLTPRG